MNELKQMNLNVRLQVDRVGMFVCRSWLEVQVFYYTVNQACPTFLAWGPNDKFRQS